jgi:hypothetical protein
MRKINDKKLMSMVKAGTLQKDIAAHFGVSPAAICKRVKRLSPAPGSLDCLTEKEQRFAIEKAKGKTQTQAALASYDCSSLDSAKNIGSQLMRKPDIQTAISDLMEYHGLSRSYRIGKLKTHVDSPDGQLSLKALDQTWKLDGSYLEEEVRAHLSYDLMSMELNQLEVELEKVNQEMGEG